MEKELDTFESEVFEDEFGYSHTTTNVLGQGGQGVVYRMEDVDLALKLSLKNGQRLTNENDIKKARREFNKLKYLPLDGLKLSTPIAVLSNETGYIMPLMSDMMPFSKLIYGEQSPKEISELPISEYISINPYFNKLEIQKLMAFYIDTKGVKRRLKALYRCALVLHQLHSRGLFFADINPNNEFISSEVDYEEVWLIDADNLNFDNNSHNINIYFPKYGSPEVVNGKSNSSIASDCYSFAILSHIILVQHYPFDGQALTQDSDWSDDGDWDNNKLSKLETGELSWIFSKKDNSNIAEIPLGFLIQEPEIFRLFEQTFELGKFDIYQRPTMNLWAIGLAKLHDRLLSCPNCHFTFATLKDERCDVCQSKRPNYLKIDIFNQYHKLIWQFVEALNDRKIKVPTRIVTDTDNEQGCLDLFEIEITNQEFIIFKKNDEWSLVLSDKNNKSYSIYSRFGGNIPDNNILELSMHSTKNSRDTYLLKLYIHH